MGAAGRYTNVRNAIIVTQHKTRSLFLLRRKFVRACGIAMLNDGQAEAPEVEIVRAVGDSLGITFATGV